MKGKQTALMPGNGDKVGYWLTPPDLMAKLQEEFHFDFDACPYPRPAGFNGLMEAWGTSTWVNPPFKHQKEGGLTDWARKAVLEAQIGKNVVLVIPVRRWLSILLEAHAEVRSIGRIVWLSPDGTPIQHPRDQALFILRGKP